MAESAQALATIRESIELLQAELARNPQDLRSWVMLARSLSEVGQFDQAVVAYRAALELSPNEADLNAAFGEALVRASDGMVPGEARAAFEIAMMRVPAEPRANYYLALERYQAGDLVAALAGWQRLAELSPPEAPWMAAVQERIAEVSAALGTGDQSGPATALAGVGSPGPESDDGAASDQPAMASVVPEDAVPGEDSPARDENLPISGDVVGDLAGEMAGELAGDGFTTGAAVAVLTEEGRMGLRPEADGIDAPGTAPPRAPPPIDPAILEMMARLTPEERNARIAGMVDGLRARLEQNPEDVDGWLMLARSYDVTGRLEAARHALDEAASRAPDRVDVQLALVRFLLAGRASADATVPDDAVAPLERILEQDPGHPDALWFLGLAAAQARDFDRARTLWQHLQSTLDPDTETYRDMQAYIDALGGQSATPPAAGDEPPVPSVNIAVDPATE